MSTLMTMRFEDDLYEELRQEALYERVLISDIIRTAVNVHLIEVFKARSPSRFCDWRGCEVLYNWITAPGGLHFCDKHMPDSHLTVADAGNESAA